MGFTLGRHPLALLRDCLKMDRMQTAEQLATLRKGQLARACGLVTVRHLIASKLVDRAELLGALPTTSREFC
ncbi:hypothetical protein WJ41_34220 [Burkholderia ubonensis]|uniref:Uncharacterized protein n=1 Tax=Burkholderia ubonensis TaxID=101571 RepID=A0A103RKF4_9BURK|nr:hypothetical protein [Burkholderia ubonensis]KVG69435.1 hypothetical protein WJ33_22645 [Burkholderia ubonensis]KVH78796.1 hypothetical protein WJ41_34220 [Burkholderia ubonensis]KVN88837.1 hypothetical protein WJ68_04705 [Burkholderia ubonensis]KVO82810.1 hypothetical protein WJ81_23655 [Burkholderia ubonensis]KVU04989.1 hypothetical protein WK61_32120 [Burkholderia ubonensis]